MIVDGHELSLNYQKGNSSLATITTTKSHQVKLKPDNWAGRAQRAVPELRPAVPGRA